MAALRSAGRKNSRINTLAERVSAALDYVTLDVFTQKRFSGNPLAVVWDGDTLSTAQMQMIAAEFGYSETTFVCKARSRECDARIRIFTPTAELPFAGHPTIGTAIAFAQRFKRGDDVVFRFEEGAGPVTVQMSRKNNIVEAEFQPPVSPHSLSEQSINLTDIIGLSETKSVCCASAGTPFAFLELSTAASVDACGPGPGFKTFAEQFEVTGLFVYAPHGSEAFYARMFAPDLGVPEDPATGSAVAALAAVLWQACPQRADYLIHQGVKMGRPSRIGLCLAPNAAGGLNTALVSGSAVPVMAGQIRV